MKYILLILMIFTINVKAQNELVFNKKSVQCEDKWVAFKNEKDSTLIYGFIYIDSQAGLTLNYEGHFTIDQKGKFIKLINEDSIKSSIKVRLNPKIEGIAEIPESKFVELQIDKIPDWLKIYKEGENTIERLFRWGYLYNGWNECEKALTYLKKAEKLDPNFNGLQTELAFSYNHLKQYDKAESALKIALKNKPKDCYTLKELAYTYRHSEKLKESEEVYNKMVKVCSEKLFIQETAYNLTYRYYELKKLKEFNKWCNEVIKWSDEENIYTKNIELMKSQLK